MDPARLTILPHSALGRALYWLSQMLAPLALPFLLIGLALRNRREPGHLANLWHRFGFGPVGPSGAVWIYAASLGETRAVSPLVRQLTEAGHAVLLTHQSPAGMAESARLFGNHPRVTRRLVPVDMVWPLRRFLARARPSALLVAEIELWPAMLRETARAGVPRIMVNGNLLAESMTVPAGWRGLLRRWVMGHYHLFDRVFTRTDTYRDRYVTLGLEPDRIAVVGEMKYDQWIDPDQVAAGQRLRRHWPADAPVLLIASSVKEEEPALLAMLAGLRKRPGLTGLRLVWAPRSPQRFDAVADILTAQGLTVARRSALGDLATATFPGETDVLLGDSTGEMNVWYPMADLVFVGASLTGDGGHNIMEPMALGRPVVMGPSIYGIAFAAGPAAQMGAFESLPDAPALEDRIARLLPDRAQLARMASAAQRFSASQTGAARRTLDGIAPLLARPR